MGKKSGPKQPSPRATAAAQTGTNIGTAIAQANLDQYNQVTPDGTLTYDQTGTYTYNDPYTHQTYEIPRYTATQTLSQQQQAIKDQSDAAQFNLASLANDQSGFLRDYLNTPFDPDEASRATADNLFKLGSARLDPRFQQEQAALETKLSNQGIKLGSTAYDRAMQDFSQGKNDAYNQLALTGQSQAFQQAQATRNQPINEITALLSGSQVDTPSYASTPQTQIPTTDVAGIIQQDYQNRFNAWQSSTAATGGLLGGLFGAGAKIIGGLSDRRMKTEISRIGATADGLPIYLFRYKAGGPMQIGLMAQDVEKTKPHAVFEDAWGTKYVDYDVALAGAV